MAAHIIILNNIFFRQCNVSPTHGIVQLVRQQSWFLLHFLMPIQNCMQLMAITKNGPNGILNISVLHMNMQMGMTNQYMLDIFTPHLLTVF